MRTDYTTTPSPVHVLHSDRYVRLYWPVSEDAAPDAFGCTPHYTLTFEHVQTRTVGKFYTATESTTQAAFPGDGTHREAITARTGIRTVIAELPAARYSAPRFAAFVKSVLG